MASPVGDYRHPRCYASILGGCSTKISLEHYISHSVLKLLSDSDGMLPVEGLPWLGPTGAMKIDAAKFGSNLLCTAHNEALSPLDEIGHRFFVAIADIPKYFEEQPTGPDRRVLVNGHDVERWMLKIAIGLGSVVLPKSKEWRPPRHWVRTLFGKRALTNGGMSCIAPVGSLVPRDARIGFAPMFWNQVEFVGVLVIVGGVRFMLLMSDQAGEVDVYRPGSLRFSGRSSGVEQIVWLGWHSPYGAKSINLTWPAD